MPPKSDAFLQDIVAAADDIIGFCSLPFAEYAADKARRLAVERQFIVIGEALNRLRKADPERAGRISDLNKIIGLRNILVHGYEVIDDRQIHHLGRNDLVGLRRIVIGLIAAPKEQTP